MNDPYFVLGIDRNATEDQIKDAYRELARKYQADNYEGSPLFDIARQKMEELDKAYDAVMMERRGQGNSQYSNSNPNANYQNQQQNNGYYGRNYNGYTYENSQYPDIRGLIMSNRLEDAEMILDGIPVEGRSAEWYYLKGQVQQRRGWFDEAYKNYSKACQMDPQNVEYTNAFNALNNNSNGGYRQTHSNNSGCGVCDMCSSLLCADCCCECMGGDLIPGC